MKAAKVIPVKTENITVEKATAQSMVVAVRATRENTKPKHITIPVTYENRTPKKLPVRTVKNPDGSTTCLIGASANQ